MTALLSWVINIYAYLNTWSRKLGGSRGKLFPLLFRDTEAASLPNNLSLELREVPNCNTLAIFDHFYWWVVPLSCNRRENFGRQLMICILSSLCSGFTAIKEQWIYEFVAWLRLSLLSSGSHEFIQPIYRDIYQMSRLIWTALLFCHRLKKTAAESYGLLCFMVITLS